MNSRYIAVFHPVKYIQYSRTIIIAGQVMSYAVGFAVNMGQPFQRLIVNETCRYDITSFPEWYLPIYLKCYALSYFFVQFIFPTIVFLYVYTKLVVFFHRRFKSSDSENKSRKILTYSSIAMTFQFVLLFSFDTVNYILTVFDITEPYEYGTFKQQFGVFCITLSSSVNPAILMVTMPQRRRIFWQLFVPAAVRHRVHAAGPNSVTNTEDTVT